MQNEETNNKRIREIKGAVCLALALFFLLCLVSYHPLDPSFTHFVAGDQTTHNFTGKAGSYTADSLVRVLGIASFLLPFMLFFCSFKYFLRQDYSITTHRAVGFLFFLLSFAGIMALLTDGGIDFRGVRLKNGIGGLIGVSVVGLLRIYFNTAGTYIILFLTLVVALTFMFEFSMVSSTGKISQFAAALFILCKNRISSFTGFVLKSAKKTDEKSEPPVIEEPQPVIKKTPPKKVEQTHFDFTKSKMDDKFNLPPLTLLEDAPQKDARVKRDALVTNSRILEKKLADFGVDARVVEVLPGPVITMYELEPAPGVKINKIVNLSDDLALALMAPSIRILAPIPGKSVIGIEIPNLKRESVFLKDVIDNTSFSESSFRLPIALGVNFVGTPVIADLTKMPHLLIAGTTGSGKSVALNAMICSILFKAQPEDVKFLMIDPKRLELSSYEGIPHLMHPVVTDPKKASQVLRWTVEEMERRYKILNDLKAKSIDAYNELLLKGLKSKTVLAIPKQADPDQETDKTADKAGSDHEVKEIKHTKLPYIIVVIDELADLMMVAPRDVEESLTRLAQMARAAGIHLIIATQRPSVDVITGLIKANFPTRISFQVSSKIDSRTIIDQQGAEKLLGAGDMLFIPPGTSKLSRIHGAYVSDKEISRIVDYIKMQAQPAYDSSIEKFALAAAQTQHESDDDFDEKYDEAVALVSELGQASISLVQRYMKIGYNRAARIIEKMEAEGVVGPSDGAKPRKVLIRKLPG
ncbi:MAG TPA: DNA translocase FtsK 4TM domain-containing protein [Smithella sp.]|nr:DNA translocase FtsK 4TM domain-containing protein [Smithella sp.]MDM7988779.1 DNA translocase FtsK 4TM domain-containing protein [Smithella sp.]HNY49274.1 DNA translocase FtsK 4TM domain-containing protein [Smithella sp.]HOG91246.1 DNA translocase FtsK 4TM domain-containing protein [Smithella sp.]HOU51006.1 DNA translocase FtsK 4TM domain-containing protein [Smithella sp.]